MFKIALVGTVSAVLLLTAGTIASAKGVGPLNSYGHRLNGVNPAGKIVTGITTTGGRTALSNSSETMASHIASVTEQMRARNAQMESATHMQPASGMDPGHGIQSGSMGTGTGYMGTGSTGSMGTTTNTRTTGGGTNMGTTGTGMGANTGHASGSGGSMMGR